MSTNITFAHVQDYLNAIADNPDNNPIDVSPHRRFWNGKKRDEFVASNVPNVTCHGAPIPVIDQNNLPDSAIQSPFFFILTSQNGFCQKRQMPGGGPFIIDPGYQVTLANGTVVTGQQIQNDLRDWLANGFPE
jgi:hypothetical protein